MQITYKLTEEDLGKYISTDFKAKEKPISKIISTIAVIILVLIVLMALIAKEYFIAICIFLLLIAIYVADKYVPKRLKKKYIKKLKETSTINELRTIELKEDEIVVSLPSRTSIYKYSEITSVNLVNNYFVLIEFNLGDSIAIPGSAFSNNTDKIDFINRIKTNAKIL